MIAVLRLGHRRNRDKRITTHCALVARAFGADKIIFSGEQDDAVLQSVSSLSKKWGGKFKASYESNWRKTIKAFKEKGVVVHLTMYGQPFNEVVSKIKNKNALIVIGAEKVPREVYDLADYNVAIGNQPHSEVAALAVFLYELLDRTPLQKEFRGWQKKIVPLPRGKKVINKFLRVIGA